MNLVGRNIEYIVKVGARTTLVINIKDSTGAVRDLSNATTYATAVWKVWKPDGTLLINGAATYGNRASGEITYALTAADTVVANEGVWEGEVEMLNSSAVMTEQSETFNFTIEESY